jgi:hypothetical protein
MTRDEPPPRWSGALATLPVLAAIAVVPLVVYLRVEPLSGDKFDFWSGQSSNYDFFSFYKARLLVGLAVVAAVGLILRLATRTSALSQLPALAGMSLAAYAALAVASTWASPFFDVALDGFPDRYEGLFVLLSYIVVFLASFAAPPTAAALQRVVVWLAGSALVVGVIGVLQYAGVDPFQTALGRVLIVPPGDAGLASLLKYPAEARTVYSTLYHYNYVGSYTALVLPFLVATLTADTISPWARRLAGGAAGLIGLVWLVCGSRAGLFGGGLALVLLAGLRRSILRPRRRALVLSAIALLLAIVAADVVLGGKIRSRATSSAADLGRVLSGAPPRVAAPPLELAAINPASVQLKTPAGVLEVRHEAGILSVHDEEHRELQLATEGETGRFQIADARFPGVEITVGRINRKPAFVVKDQAYVLNFLLLDSGIQLALKTGRAVSPAKAETFGFSGMETLGSARGFIWSRSLPLLRGTLLLGHGPDTFAMVFPQQDFSGKFQVYGTTNIIVDKAHDFFLQTALNTGALSALALVVLFAWYLAMSARTYVRQPANGLRGGIGVACFVSVVGYLGSVLFNDSVVCVAPVFWALLGLGIRVNIEHGGKNCEVAT